MSWFCYFSHEVGGGGWSIHTARSLFIAHPTSTLQLSESSQSEQCNLIHLLTILITGSGRLVINGKWNKTFVQLHLEEEFKWIRSSAHNSVSKHRFTNATPMVYTFVLHWRPNKFFGVDKLQMLVAFKLEWIRNALPQWTHRWQPKLYAICACMYITG